MVGFGRTILAAAFATALTSSGRGGNPEGIRCSAIALRCLQEQRRRPGQCLRNLEGQLDLDAGEQQTGVTGEPGYLRATHARRTIVRQQKPQ